MATATLPTADQAVDTFPINGTDYIEFWVGNAKQACHFYRSAFGMDVVAYRGPETGVRDRASYLLQQDKVRFVLTTPIRSEGVIAEHISEARRWCSRHRDLGRRCAYGVPAGGRARSRAGAWSRR